MGSKLREIESHAFSDSGITNIDLPKEIEKIGNYAFRECSSLKHISLPKSIEEIPRGCFYRSGLEEIVIPRKVKKIVGNGYLDGAFQGCENLRSVVFEQGSELAEIGNLAFCLCKSLQNICLPDKLKEI